MERIRDLCDTLGIVCGLNPLTYELLKKVETCKNPSRKMQSIADKINISTQDLMPIMARLENLRNQYSEEFMKVCEHEFVTDEVEVFTSESRCYDDGPTMRRITFCVYCEKQL